MTALFRGGSELVTRTNDFHNFILAENKEVVTDDGRRFLMPVGSVSDLASTPKLLWGLGLPPFGVYAPAAFFHDLAYRNTLKQWHEDEWVDAMLEEKDANAIMDALMFSVGTPEPIRKEIKTALDLFGWKAFREDRAAIPPRPQNQ